MVGVQRAPRDQEGYGQKGPSRSGETKRGGEREREREGGEYSSGSSSGSCRCQCPPSCYPRRGPPEDSGAGHGGSSGSQIFFLSTCRERDPSKYRRGKAEIDREERKRSRNGLSDGEYPFGRARFAPSSLEPVQLGVSATNDKREQRSPRILAVTTLEASLELCCLPNAKSLPTFALLRTGERERERRGAKTKRSSRRRMSQGTGTKGSEVAKRDSARRARLARQNEME